MTQNRRNFLLTGWKVGGAFLIGAAGYTAYEALRPLAAASGGGKLKLGAPGDFPSGARRIVELDRLQVRMPREEGPALGERRRVAQHPLQRVERRAGKAQETVRTATTVSSTGMSPGKAASASRLPGTAPIVVFSTGITP